MEFICRIKLKLNRYLKGERNYIDYCYFILEKVSRSFSMVIKQLPPQLKDVICVFYLILRGLDTIEDDFNYPKEKKIILLRNFIHKLHSSNWSIENVGENEDYQQLLANFNRIINIFQSFDLKYQRIITDITQKMANGMADFIENDSFIDTIEKYNLYCYYVAGLVGEGLTSLFNSSQLENNLSEQLSYHMGLFLQKTNIIRDYQEDIQQGRFWWPKQIWSKYAKDIFYFKDHPNDQLSLQCLNDMIMDAFNHLPHVINYLKQIENKEIFKFCSIPQMMALATLSHLYGNPLVFTSNVKIPKYLSIEMMLHSNNLNEIYYWIDFFLTNMEKKIPNNNHQLIQQIKQMY